MRCIQEKETAVCDALFLKSAWHTVVRGWFVSDKLILAILDVLIAEGDLVEFSPRKRALVLL